MKDEEVRQQSLMAYKQWAVQWREHAKIHSRYAMKSLAEFENFGVGKAVLCVANGYSFEKNLETIKRNRQNVYIMACDKTLGHLIRNGIKPDFLMLCDANVSYEKYLEPWKDQLDETILFSNVCANPKWTASGNWKDIFFFVNQDVLGSEREFGQISGCPNRMAAATNVSNAMVVFLTQSDNSGRKNFFGFDKILLIGFDYCWSPDGNYYAFDKTGNGKNNYMRHVYCWDMDRNAQYTSNNLLFSAKWLEKYISSFNLPVVQCTRETILALRLNSDLESQMKYSYKPEDRDKVRKLFETRARAMAAARQAETEVLKIGRDHFYRSMASI